MEKFHGRPADMAGRFDKEIACFDLLDRLEIDYCGMDHPAAMTMNDCAATDLLLGGDTCKNLFLCNRQKTNFYLLLIDGKKSFQTKEFSKQMGISRVSFAGAEFMEEFLGVTPGSVTVLGLMNDLENRVQLVIDQSVLDSKTMGCHPCINTCTLQFSIADLLEKVLKEINHQPIFVDLPREEL